MSRQKEQVLIIGSGNWGSAVSIIIGQNVKANPDVFEPRVPIWVYDEQVEGQSLVKLFNERHENVKYLPGRKIPDNVVASGDLEELAKGATALVFVMPHQFIAKACDRLKGRLPISKKVRAISLAKGVEFDHDKISLFTDQIEQSLGITCAALSGANIANEIADGDFSETTIGCRDPEDAEMWKLLFNTNHFRVSLTDDVTGVSLCGALKNAVALAAGFCDGLGWGSNSKAAIMRIGLMEMKHFSQEFFDGVRDDTFMAESCGVADLITTCIGGRNRKCAEAFVKTKKSFAELEEEMLNGQKLQGAQTTEEVYKFLKAKGRLEGYPLFNAIYQIAFAGHPVDKITQLF